MKARIAIAFLTVVLLAAGFGAGLWTARSHCKVPPPPPSLLGEFSPKPADGSGGRTAPATPSKSAPAPDTTWLATQIEQLGPQIDQFRKKLDAIDRELDAKIESILRPDQLAAWHDLVQRGVEMRAQEQAQSALTTKLSPEEVEELQRRPLYRLLGIVVIPIRVYWNTRQLGLDDAQAAKLTELLKWRRERVLELIDESPPPSLQLSMLAPLVARLGEPGKHEPEKASPPPSNQP
jgi:hypothetical protein